MNPLIERYIYDVVRHLPEKDRSRVEQELQAKIMGMLGENPSDEDITRVLNTMGAPAAKAEEYRTGKRYLISPAVYDEYWTALRVMAVVLFVALLVGSVIRFIVEGPSTMSVAALTTNMLLTIVICAFSAAVAAFVITTVIFVCIERIGKGKSERAWSVHDLPKMPHRSGRISRNATLISMIFSVIFSAVIIVVMLRFSQYLALYTDFTPTVPLFYPDILAGLVPYVIALAIGVLIVNAMKLYYGYWTYPLAFVTSLLRVASGAFMIYFFNYAGVFNQEFISGMADMLSWDINTVELWFQRGLLIITAIIILVSVWDIAKSFYLAYRSETRGRG